MLRLAFDVDDQFNQEFNELVRLTGASSKADAFRKAISLYKEAIDSTSERDTETVNWYKEASSLYNKAINLKSENRYEEAIARFEEVINLASERDTETVNLIAIDSDKSVNRLVSVAKKYHNTLDDLDSAKTGEIFSQIDLAQARITKDQEEIDVLAKETDELLNKLEYMAS